jgi:hypothetical protein
MTDDLVKRLRRELPMGEDCIAPEYTCVAGDCPCDSANIIAAADRIEQLEKGFREILTLDSPMLMQIIARACLTGAIDADGKYCFVPPFALGEKKDD